MLSLKNYLICKKIDNDKELHEFGDRICMMRDKNSLMYYTKEFIKRACDIINSSTKRITEYPNIKFDLLDYSGKYIANTNTIVLDKDSITVPNILHEFRHYLQFQFKEPFYYNGNLSPLPQPFYRFQLHEINAYDFQHRYEYSNERNISEEISGIFEDANYLIKIGAFNPIAFHIEHEYYKYYNKLFDQMDMSNEELYAEFPMCKIKDFTQKFNGRNVHINHYQTDINFFNLKFNVYNRNYEANFEIKDNKCIIYGISAENLEICEKEEYSKACNLAFDFASNISKIYKANELDINPYSLNIHKNIFKEIINDYKSNHLGINDYLKFNHIPNPMPKEDITKNLIEVLCVDDNKSITEYINQDKILENNKEVCVESILNNINRDNEAR